MSETQHSSFVSSVILSFISFAYCFLLASSAPVISELAQSLRNVIPPTLYSNCTLVFIFERGKNEEFLNIALSNIFIHSSKIIMPYNSSEYIPNDNSNKPATFFVSKRLCKVALVQAPQQYQLFSTPGNLLYSQFEKHKSFLSMTQDYFIVFDTGNHGTVDKILRDGPVSQNVKNKIGVKFVMVEGTEKIRISYIWTCVFCRRFERLVHANASQVDNVFPDMLRNFRIKKFRISTIMSTKVLIEIRKNSKGKWQAVRGVSKFCIEHLMHQFNFTDKYLPAGRGGGPGILLPNGTWLGETADIFEGDADLGVLIFNTFLRNQYVSFTVPVKYVNVMFVNGEPERDYSWRSIYWPLEPLVWYLVFASSFLTFLALRMFLFFNDVKLNECNQKAAAYLFVTFMGQDGREMDTRHSTRLLISLWFIFGIVIMTAYCSKLVGLLSFPVLEDTPKSWRALAETSSSEYQISLQYNKGAVYTIFRTTTNPTFLKILPRINLQQNPIKCFKDSIESSKHVCICIDLIVDYIVKRNLSDKSGSVPMVTAPDKLNFYPMALVVRKGAVFLDKFDSVLGTSAAMGLPDKWSRLDDEIIRKERREWEMAQGKVQVVYEDQDGTRPLKMQNYTGTFYILIVGSVIASLGFIKEYFTTKHAPMLTDGDNTVNRINEKEEKKMEQNFCRALELIKVLTGERDFSARRKSQVDIATQSSLSTFSKLLKNWKIKLFSVPSNYKQLQE